MSVSFDGQKGRFCLTNYGRVPAILNKIEFPSDLDRLKETDNFSSYLFGEESRKPFEDLEGTVIGPNLSYHFYAETSVDILKKNPYITIILEYCAANRFSLRKSPYKERFKINLRPSEGYTTALLVRRIREKNENNG